MHVYLCVCVCGSVFPALLTDKAVLFILGATCVSCPTALFGWSGLPAHRKHTLLISATHTHTHIEIHITTVHEYPQGKIAYAQAHTHKHKLCAT